MKKYIVIALSVGGLGNRIFNSGDTVREDNFPAGNAEKLVKEGYLKPLEEEKKSTSKTTEVENPSTGSGSEENASSEGKPSTGSVTTKKSKK